MNRKSLLLMVSALVMLLASCSSKKEIVYLQNSVQGLTRPITQSSKILAQPGDKLSIVVTCSDPQTSALFSLISPRRTMNFSQNTNTTGESDLAAYTVDSQGNINFPILGTLHVAGMTREQISSMIRNDLVAKQLVKDPIVVTEFGNLHFTVMGEVSSPGKYAINNDHVTILEALAQAGDLTIMGRRDNVKVVREENGQRTTYLVDLRDESLFDSPVYHLQQNDVVYVEPNGTRVGQSRVNENTWKSPSLWISIASFLTTIGVLVFK